MGHFGRIRTVTAAGGASSKRQDTIALRVAPHRANGSRSPRHASRPALRRTERHKTTQNEKQATPKLEDELFLSWSPMFVAARAAHAKISDRGRGKRARSAFLSSSSPASNGRAGAGSSPWRDGCRTDFHVNTDSQETAENQRCETVRRATARASSAAPFQQAGFRGDGKPRNQRGRRFACPTREPGEAAS